MKHSHARTHFTLPVFLSRARISGTTCWCRSPPESIWEARLDSFSSDLRESHLRLFFFPASDQSNRRGGRMQFHFVPATYGIIQSYSYMNVFQCWFPFHSIDAPPNFHFFIFSCHSRCHIFHQPRHPFLFGHDRNTRFESYKTKNRTC